MESPIFSPAHFRQKRPHEKDLAWSEVVGIQAHAPAGVARKLHVLTVEINGFVDHYRRVSLRVGKGLNQIPVKPEFQADIPGQVIIRMEIVRRFRDGKLLRNFVYAGEIDRVNGLAWNARDFIDVKHQLQERLFYKHTVSPGVRRDSLSSVAGVSG